jgi:hypothetical protein
MDGARLLPEMHEVGRTPTKPISSYNEVNIVGESTFSLCSLPPLATDPSTLLSCGTYQGRAVSIDCNGEASVESSVLMMLMDILKALNLFDGLTVHQQATTDSQERGDLFVLTVFGVIILILEAKRKSLVWNDLNHRKCLGQPFNYMRTNRECLSLSYCFGVWTTYNQCRIIWLNDAEHNALAAATTVDPANKFPLPPNHYDWRGRNVCASQIYERKDNIPMVMACLVWKLCNAQLVAKTMLIRGITPSATSIASVAAEADESNNAHQQRGAAAAKRSSKKGSNNAHQQRGAAAAKRSSKKGSNNAHQQSGAATVVVSDEIRQGKLRTVNMHGYYFKINQRAVDDLTFEMPSISGKFHLLLQHNGRDGKAWVAANMSGHLAVVKFRHGDKKFKFSLDVTEDDNDDEIEESFAALSIGAGHSTSSNSNSTLVNAERQAWEAMYGGIGGGRPFIVTLAGREALVIPFAFCFDSNGHLSSDLSSYLPCDDSFGNGMKDWFDIQSQLVAHSTDAVKLLFAAVVRVAEAGYRHNDIKWEHLALLPVYLSKNSGPRLEPILVDLADVEKDSNGLAAMAAYVLDSVLHNEIEKQEFEQLLREKEA